MRLRDSQKLGLIVLAAVAARVFTLWVGRGEFAGWLNHSYYYFVQTKGLLETGVLPYADMPLLFRAYALIARTLIGLGLAPNDAVVVSTRLVMIVVPALIPLPIYGIVQRMNGGEPVSGNQWVLILLSGFLPLTLGYLPDSQQKNMIGLVLLAALVWISQRLLRGARLKDVLLFTLVALAIVLTHYGTSAAMILYGVALVAALALAGREPATAIVPGLLLVLGSGLAAGLVYLFDAQRFERLLVYLGGSFQSSLVGGLLSKGGSRPGLWMSLAAVLLVYALLFLLYVAYLRRGSSLPPDARIFWLANILFCGLLVLPVLDESLMGRLAVFLSIPLLVLLLHLEKHCIERRWLRAMGVLTVAGGVLAMSVGELISSRIHNRNHEAVLADIRALQQMNVLQPNDLVITRTGAEHICNWFFGVEAGMITTLTLDDFARYDSVYVLNPADGGFGPDGLAGRQATDEKSRYLFMRSNVPRPYSAIPLFTSKSMEIFELESPPEEWVFDDEGRWSGYSALGDP